MWKRKHQLPSKILKAVELLKNEQGTYISARKVNDTFYIYKEWLVWDSYKKKQHIKSEYIGRIDRSGTFVKKSSNRRLNLENAIKLIEEQGGRVTLPEARSEETNEAKPKNEDLEILTCLTMNSRLPAKRIAKITGLEESEIYYRINVLEKKYSISYLAQFFGPPLGYYPYLILIKFLEEKPTQEELKSAFAAEPKVQLVLSVKGEYDVIGYILEESPFKAELTAIKLRTDTTLSRYKAVFYTTPMSQRFGYLHLRNEFFTEVLKSRLERHKEAENEQKIPLVERELMVLTELNENGAIEFNEIDRRHGFSRGTSLYTYDRLKERGIIARITINMKEMGMKYLGAIFIKRLDMSKYIKTRDYLYKDVITDENFIDKYALVCEVGSPDMIILIMPITGKDSIEENANRLKARLDGVEITTGIITDNILGAICLRRFDNEYTYYYNDLVSEKKLPYKIKTDYESKPQYRGI